MEALIFGGAFDPLHSEHVNILINSIKNLGFKGKTIIVPTFLPPHKSKAVIDFETRVKLIDETLKGVGIDYEISDIEFRRGDDNYASEILECFKKEYDKLYYLIGGDSLLTLESWHNPEKVMSLATLLVCDRTGYSGIDEKIEYFRKKYNADIIKTDYEGKAVSSTLLRTRLMLGLDTDVPMIEKVKPYFNQLGEVLDKLKGMQTDDLFLHSRAVAYRAVELNRLHGLNLDPYKCLMAGLLHDNAKQRLSLDGFDVPQDAIGTPVLHQFLGALKAERDFGIRDKEILSSIKYHTTGKAEMTTLEKLIYSADMLSEDRPDIERLLQVMKNDFEIGFKACLSSSYFYVLSKKKGMYPLTQEAFEFYIMNNKE
ncbi:MAG: bis(5'-nucleosyl)-tetraphosphatase (symmetrical) YqeK [Christensenellales bacterium]